MRKIIILLAVLLTLPALVASAAEPSANLTPFDSSSIACPAAASGTALAGMATDEAMPAEVEGRLEAAAGPSFGCAPGAERWLTVGCCSATKGRDIYQYCDSTGQWVATGHERCLNACPDW